MSLHTTKGMNEPPRLEEGNVLVWTADLDNVTETRLEQLAYLLSQDENQRVFRFRFQKDRKRFVVCRGTLREILGTYLQRDPDKIDFHFGAQGKPYLKDPDEQTARLLYFNVSHSSGKAIYALGLSEVGVDLEVVRPVPEMLTLVDQYFSFSERKAFGSIPPDLKLKAFYHCWTRKEAYVKALGGGLSIPLDEFDVSIDPNSPTRLISAQGISGDQLPWSLHSFVFSADVIGALVCPRNNELRFCGSWLGAEPPSWQLLPSNCCPPVG